MEYYLFNFCHSFSLLFLGIFAFLFTFLVHMLCELIIPCTLFWKWCLALRAPAIYSTAAPQRWRVVHVSANGHSDWTGKSSRLEISPKCERGRACVRECQERTALCLFTQTFLFDSELLWLQKVKLVFVWCKYALVLGKHWRVHCPDLPFISQRHLDIYR